MEFPSFPYMPPDLSAHGASLDALLWWLHILMAVLFVGWGAFFVYTMVRFRSGARPKADYVGARSHFSSYLEVGIVVIEGVLLFGLAIPLWAEWASVGQAQQGAPGENGEKPFEVRVVGQQFAWKVHYPGPDGAFGPLRVDLVNEQSNPLGLDRDAPAAKDDFVLEALVVPADTPVICHVSSKDVIHGFWLPVMRVKQDAIPGMSVPVGFQATTTSVAFRTKEAERNPEKYRRIRLEQEFENYKLGKIAEEFGNNPDKYESFDQVREAFDRDPQKYGMTMADLKEEFDASPARYGNLVELVPDLEIACAQLCGNQHYKMVRKFFIVDREDFAGLKTENDFIAWIGANQSKWLPQ